MSKQPYLAPLKPLELEVRLPRPLRTSRNGGGCKSCWGLNFSSTDLLFCVDEEGAGKKLFFVVFNGLGMALEPLNEDIILLIFASFNTDSFTRYFLD